MRRMTEVSLLCLLLAGCSQPDPVANGNIAARSPDGRVEGRIEGPFAPGSRFALLRIGLSKSQVEVLIGRPWDTDAHTTGRQFIPLYFGGDQSRTVSYYLGVGRLEFADLSFSGSAATLVRIVNDPAESGGRP